MGTSKRIINIEGIGSQYSRKLENAGIKTTKDLLKACRTPRERDELARSSGVGHKLLLEWANRADLWRIKGVAEEYSDLLENTGVDTVVELSKRNPDNLYEMLMAKAHATGHRIVRRPPSKKQVASWVSQAKKLPRMLEY